MTISALQAAKFLSNLSHWKYTHLELQKLIYLSHMLHLGQYRQPLVAGRFEAWDYGPVHPELYQILKEWGNRPIPASAKVYQNVDITVFKTTATNEARSLKQWAKALPPGNGPKLIAITHAQDCAWTKAYDKVVKSRVITDDAMLDEYQSRLNA